VGSEGLKTISLAFEGVNVKFLEVISDSLGRVEERYARMLDYIQYNNPPFNQHIMKRELGIPQPSISRTLTRLRKEAGVRVRADIDINKIGLKTLFVIYEGVLLPAYPAQDWLASAWWSSRGTVMIYRVPPAHEKRLLELITKSVGREPDDVTGVKASIIAKPSIKYYMWNREQLDPITALKLAEEHPPVPKEMVDLEPTEYEISFEDPRTMELLSLLEHDIFEAKEMYSEKHGLRMYLKKLKIARKVLRGSRVMFLDKDNMMSYIKLKAERKCIDSISKVLVVYPYVTNLFLTDDHNLIIVASTPSRYLLKFMKALQDYCGPKSAMLDTYVGTLDGLQVRQYIPWENFSKDKGQWDFDDHVPLVLSRLLRSATTLESRLGLYQWSVKEYLKRLVEAMGEDFVKEQIAKLRDPVRAEVLKLLRDVTGKQGGSNASPQS